MSLVVNHNLMAMNAARNLGTIYGRLAKSTERLSSGLRINSAADDAAGLAIRELMRADLAVMQQGIRNASDGISMIQTAEGAMAVIDEKLTRMKELAEQAATGTYTTVQRDIMNSEYQAMAAEIDRIAESTEFNGIKLMNGSLSDLHGGSGLKIHFGTGNSSKEDYYYVRINDVRATYNTGLRVGGDAKNDVWAQGGFVLENGGVNGCCGIGGVGDLDDEIPNASGQAFAYSYNYTADDDLEPNGSGLATPSYLAGIYKLASGESLRDLIDSVNEGTQSRIKIDFDTSGLAASALALGSEVSGALNICIGNEIYQFISGGTASASLDPGNKDIYLGIDASNGTSASTLLVNAINSCSVSFWAMETSGDVYVFTRDGGNFDALTACDEGIGTTGISAASTHIRWQNMETYQTYQSGTTFGNGGQKWATMYGIKTNDRWGLTLNGRDVGEYHDLRIVEVGSASNIADINVAGYISSNLAGFTPRDFTEIQNALDGPWDGAHIRTQSHAQEALEAIQEAINRKDVIRANLGAYQNRLENTITNMSIMAENLQASESRISDIDVATEMTEFTRNNILAQAATSMLAQANSLPQLALSLLG